MNAPPGIGHNQPPSEISAWEESAERSVTRQKELVAAMARVPSAITNDEVNTRVGAFIVQLRKCTKELDKDRLELTRPYDAAKARCKAHFDALIKPLSEQIAKLERGQKVFLDMKAARIRREAQERAQREQEAAARLAQQAAASGDQATAAEAQTAQAEAVAAREVATARPAELVRSHGDYGNTVSMVGQWTFRNLDRDKLDLEKLRPYIDTESLEKAVRAAIRVGGFKPKPGEAQPIAGVEIFEDFKPRNT